MTQANTPQDPIDRLANIVERFINASSARQDQLETKQEQLEARQAQVENRQSQLERAQIRFQEQLGELAGYVRQAMERQDQRDRELEEYRRRHDEELEQIRQRQAESDQRFDVMLQEIRYLIRQQRSAEDDPTQGEEGA